MPDKTIVRIMKVNHAGEYGAIRIYGAQLLVSKILHKDLVPFLEQTLAHETLHAQKFIHAMKVRQSRPCRAMPLWGIGGWVLGFFTACMGKNAVLICTEAVESAVHRHLQDQIRYLDGKDAELRNIILDIEKEEIEHLEYAQEHVKRSWLTKPLFGLITVSTEIVIWLSTQGDVTRMKKAIAQ
ncbi:MAG: demethoxyubiquinone hydroxylase family protein [Parvibaculaceae bacterium]